MKLHIAFRWSSARMLRAGVLTLILTLEQQQASCWSIPSWLSECVDLLLYIVH